MDMQDIDARALTSFDKLITPKIIEVLFWIGVGASVVAGLGMLLTGGLGVPLGLVVLIGGPVLTRVVCELLIIAFKAFNWLGEIKATLAQQTLARDADSRTAPKDDASSPAEAETPPRP